MENTSKTTNHKPALGSVAALLEAIAREARRHTAAQRDPRPVTVQFGFPNIGTADVAGTDKHAITLAASYTKTMKALRDGTADATEQKRAAQYLLAASRVIAMLPSDDATYRRTELAVGRANFEEHLMEEHGVEFGEAVDRETGNLLRVIEGHEDETGRPSPERKAMILEQLMVERLMEGIPVKGQPTRTSANAQADGDGGESPCPDAKEVK